jgi:hypothetical protein
MLTDKCVECRDEFELEDLSHVWMEYEPDDLEEDDEPNEYVGVMCQPCLDAASAMCDMPVIQIIPDEEEID